MVWKRTLIDGVVPDPEPLPAEVFDRAINDHLTYHEARIRAMFVYHRAVFAEHIVAQLLPGARVSEDPTAAWDVVWPNPDPGCPDIRIQVKCSGEYKPRKPDKASHAEWDLTPPKKGWDAEQRLDLAAGHHCDVFVLARHEGTDITAGWTFHVLTLRQVEGLPNTILPKVRLKHLAQLAAYPVGPAGLADEVRLAVRPGT